MQEFKQIRLKASVIWWKNFRTIKFLPNEVQVIVSFQNSELKHNVSLLVKTSFMQCLSNFEPERYFK